MIRALVSHLFRYGEVVMRIGTYGFSTNFEDLCRFTKESISRFE
jgi:hypothetical protein